MIKEKLNEMIAQAMKSGNQTELAVWRSIKTEFSKYVTAKAGNTIDDTIEAQILTKMANQRKDSYEQFTAGNRPELAKNEELELEILNRLIPKEPSELEIEEAVQGAITVISLSKDKPGEKVSMKDMKQIMEVVKTKYPTANGAIISKYVKNMMG